MAYSSEAEKHGCRARSFSSGGSDSNFYSYCSLPQKTYDFLYFYIKFYGFEGAGWKPEWVEEYNKGHRGLICLMLDVVDLDEIYEEMVNIYSISISKPKYLQFKWGFGLFTRTMPWRNSYFPFFEGIPLQIGLQQMRDEKSVEFMRQYMVPNSKDNGINGIEEIKINGAFTESDFKLINTIFKTKESIENGVVIYLDYNQKIFFESADEYKVTVTLYSSNIKHSEVKIENILISN